MDEPIQKVTPSKDDYFPPHRQIHFVKQEGGLSFWEDNEGNMFLQTEDCLGG